MRKALRAVLQAITFVLVFGLVSAYAQESIVIFQWTDDTGRQHYTNNFNSIPKPFRAAAVKGVFIPDTKAQPAKPKCDNVAPNSQDTNYYLKSGSLHVEGKIANGYAQSISYVKVKVSFFDANDQFIKAESTFADPLELAPCEKGVFSVVSPHVPGITNFKLEFTWK